jgi:hypothetical protein
MAGCTRDVLCRLKLDPLRSRNAQLANDLSDEPHADVSAFVHRDRNDLSHLRMDHAGMLASGERANETKRSELAYHVTGLKRREPCHTECW